MTDVTIKEALAELRRERAMRNHVYPRLVASGKLTEEQAAEQNARLDAAIAILRPMEEAARPQGKLAL